MADSTPDDEGEQQQNSGQVDLSEMDREELINLIHELRGRIQGLGGSVEAMQAVTDVGRRQDAERLAGQANAVEASDQQLAESLRARAEDISGEDIEDLDAEVGFE